MIGRLRQRTVEERVTATSKPKTIRGREAAGRVEGFLTSRLVARFLS